jgi:hypothetical protein
MFNDQTAKGRVAPASARFTSVGHPVGVPPRVLMLYWLNEPVCSIRVIVASPATVLPLWNTWALAAGAIATARLKAANAARNRFFIGILHLQSGGNVRL